MDDLWNSGCFGQTKRTGWGSGRTKVLHHLYIFRQFSFTDESPAPRQHLPPLIQPFRHGYATLMGLLSSGFLKRSQSMPAMAIPTQSQVKKLKRLMTEKMSWEMAYIMDSKHWYKKDKIVLVFHAHHIKAHAVLICYTQIICWVCKLLYSF